MAISGDIFDCHDHGTRTTGLSGQRPGMLVNILQCVHRAALWEGSRDLVVKGQTLRVPVLLCN